RIGTSKLSHDATGTTTDLDNAPGCDPRAFCRALHLIGFEPRIFRVPRRIGRQISTIAIPIHDHLSAQKAIRMTSLESSRNATPPQTDRERVPGLLGELGTPRGGGGRRGSASRSWRVVGGSVLE